MAISIPARPARWTSIAQRDAFVKAMQAQEIIDYKAYRKAIKDKAKAELQAAIRARRDA
jgi:hypothetical protein